jgi:hypothetical protein
VIGDASGEDQTNSVYIAKLEELKAVCGPVESRHAEERTRPAAARQLRSLAETNLNLATSGSGKHAHLSEEEKARVVNESLKVFLWLAEMLARQEKVARHEEPWLLTSDIMKKQEAMDRCCKPILSKPAHAPVKVGPPTPAPEAVLLQSGQQAKY